MQECPELALWLDQLLPAREQSAACSPPPRASCVSARGASSAAPRGLLEKLRGYPSRFSGPGVPPTTPAVELPVALGPRVRVSQDWE